MLAVKMTALREELTGELREVKGIAGRQDDGATCGADGEITPGGGAFRSVERKAN